MKHECRYKHLISPFLDGELSDHDADELQAHIISCKACKKEYQSFQHIDKILLDLEDVEPSSNFNRSFWQKISDIESKKEQWTLVNPFSWNLKPYIATVAVVIIITGVYIFHKQPITPEPDEIFIAENLELLKNYEVINHLEFIEHLDEIMALKENS